MRYWYRVADGWLRAEAPDEPTVGHSGYARTPDVPALPGPIECCAWNGSSVVVDATRLAECKARLRHIIEDKAVVGVGETVLSTPWGDFRVRRDDIDAYQMIGFTAIYAIQTSTAFSVQIRKADDTMATLTAAQFVRLLALVGDRMATRLAARDTKLNALATATAEDLKTFTP